MIALVGIKGRITNDKNEGLELVNIGIINQSIPIGTTTDNQGYYNFKVPANKDLELAISYIGYATKLYKLKLKPNEIKEVNFSLIVSNTTLGEIEIKEDNSRNEGVTKLKTEWAKNVVGPTSGIEGLLKTFEGVSSNNELSSQYSVRGGNFVQRDGGRAVPDVGAVAGQPDAAPALVCRNSTASPTLRLSAARPVTGVCTSPAPSRDR